ncbi:Intraflagellar transport protein 56 [Polyplax serrata]|uniref:Intraflagellar transport protein 56 n=1 Tax=Polyplax serrata TaxID=468196 RepID=A0ABR1B9Y4_POLSC
MILTRSSAAAPKTNSDGATRKNNYQFQDFIQKRDYVGAITVLQFKPTDTELWLGFCHFHLGDYKKAADIYKSIKNPTSEVYLNLACCYFFLGYYTEATEAVSKAEKSDLKTRLQFHLSHKIGDEKKLMEYHHQLHDVVEDQLSLASIHYLRAHYQEAIDIYKRILLHNREYVALNVYIALCYYKLGYYDVSQEVLNIYLQQFPDSIIAVNLKACNNFKLYSGKTAETEIKVLIDQNTSNVGFGHDLIKHNIVVFKGGEEALQVLPPLLDIIPEARLNFVIYYLKQEEVQEAYELIKSLEPAVPQEYILKGVVNASLGQETGLQEHLKIAQQYFQLVGSSVSECDTIPGRQCMASYHFLIRQFDQVHRYLSSIKSYFFNDDHFNFNFSQAQVALGSYAEAEETLLLIQSEKFRSDYCYISHLCRCLIMNKKPQKAWELYLKLDTSAESFSLLQLIANDSYKMGEFYYAAKAFDILERLDPLPEYWEGKRGACCGLFQMVIAKKQPKEILSEIIPLLRNSVNPQVEVIIRLIKRWAKDNRLAL